MRPYKQKEELEAFIGNVFTATSDMLSGYNGLKVKRVIRELDGSEYERELVDETDVNDAGECRYLINTMLRVELEDGTEIVVYEDEIGGTAAYQSFSELLESESILAVS